MWGGVGWMGGVVVGGRTSTNNGFPGIFGGWLVVIISIAIIIVISIRTIINIAIITTIIILITTIITGIIIIIIIINIAMIAIIVLNVIIITILIVVVAGAAVGNARSRAVLLLGPSPGRGPKS
jgi:hypothetical protein